MSGTGVAKSCIKRLQHFIHTYNEFLVGAGY